MIKIFTFLFTFLIMGTLNAQIVTVVGSSLPEDVDGDYTLSEIINGRPSYTNLGGWSPGEFRIQWSGTRWELIPIPAPNEIVFYNDLDTPTPPASSLAPWTGDSGSDSGGVFSGDGTTTTVVGLTDFEAINKELYVSPNPSSKYITVSGLEIKEHFIVYDYLGTEILQGTISDNEIIDIQNLARGLYFFKSKSGNTIKFMKD